jgi:hypothetical protein
MSRPKLRSAPFRFPQLNSRITIPFRLAPWRYTSVLTFCGNGERRLMDFSSVPGENNIPFARDESVSLTFAEYTHSCEYTRARVPRLDRVSAIRGVKSSHFSRIALHKVTLSLSLSLSLPLVVFARFDPSGSFDTLRFPPERYPVDRPGRSAESIPRRSKGNEKAHPPDSVILQVLTCAIGLTHNLSPGA